MAVDNLCTTRRGGRPEKSGAVYILAQEFFLFSNYLYDTIQKIFVNQIVDYLLQTFRKIHQLNREKQIHLQLNL